MRVQVFAVEDTTAQVCWAGLPAGTVVTAADAAVEVPDDDRPGAASLSGLSPGREVELVVRRPGKAPRPVERFSTLAPPPGELLCRFATVNDLHIGEPGFGAVKRIREEPVPGRDPYPLRCARAALDEALAWGAQALVAKGDLTYSGRQWQWDVVGPLLASVPVPIDVLLGNHDVVRRAVDGRVALSAHGVEIPEEPFHRDLPGIRVVLPHTAVPRRGRGRLMPPQRERVRELVASADGPAFLAMHHHAHPATLPTTYPPGIPGQQARALLDAIAAANPATLVASGHSHRHRTRHHGFLVLTEIGATMHYPGTWAGYAVHEGGIRQVVRRVAAPHAIEWTERTRRVVGGVWGRYSPGRLSDRCFTHTWPERG